jgi:hypothetical protein
VTYSAPSAAALEKTGRTLGFVTGVRATKGTGSSDGTTNDGIRITWTKPARIPDSKNPSYYVFRKREAIAADSWIPLTSSPVTAVFYDNKLGESNPPADGTAYEYVVGISLDGMVSHPEENARFAAQLRTEMDDTYTAEQKMSGFVLPKPTIISASGGTDPDAPQTASGITVKWNSAGVDSLSSARKNRGVAGYAIEVRDQSKNRVWKVIKTIDLSGDPAEFTEVLGNTGGLLSVIRDYRHYFRIRAYVDDGGKIYGPPPADLPLGGSEDQDDFIKWGTRKVTDIEEFTAALSLAIGVALQNDSTGGYNFSKALTSKTPLFTTISGTLTGTSQDLLSQNAKYYGAKYALFNGPAASQFELTFTGAINGFSGKVKVSKLDSGGGGTFQVDFNGSGYKNVDKKHFLKPFTFGSSTFKSCDSLSWTLETGWQE